MPLSLLEYTVMKFCKNKNLRTRYLIIFNQGQPDRLLMMSTMFRVLGFRVTCFKEILANCGNNLCTTMPTDKVIDTGPSCPGSTL
jgi:hypothetical protein